MRRLAPLFVLPFLVGCADTDWRSLMPFSSARAEASSAPAPTPARAAPPASQASAGTPTNELCAAAARREAAEYGFDAATQQRVALRSYQQCAAIFGSPQ